MKKKRYIVHVDMDAFFAAIEQRDNPQLRSKPVIVGADPKSGKGRGVVSTCSYEARRFGIRSAMPISEAYRACPNAVFLRGDMQKYEAVSGQIYDILYSFTPDIEPVGIDEAFLDISTSHRLFAGPCETCLRIKSRIKNEVGLTASIGLAPTKTAAKIASDLKKPDGMVEVREEDLLDFLRPLEIRKLWGLGEKTQKTLNGMGVRTIGELAEQDVRTLAHIFGKNGEHLWRLAKGIDKSPVLAGREAKSVSGEATFDKDTSDRGAIEGELIAICEKVSMRLRQSGFKSRNITLKIRLKGFQTYTRSVTLEKATNFSDVLYKAIKDLYNKFDLKNKLVRLVGVRASNISPATTEQSLFADDPDEKKERVHSAVDMIRKKFGATAICRAGSSTSITRNR